MELGLHCDSGAPAPIKTYPFFVWAPAVILPKLYGLGFRVQGPFS